MMMDPSVARSMDLGAIKPGTYVSFVMERPCDGMCAVYSTTPVPGGH